MYVCVYVCMYVYTYVCMYVYVCLCMRVCLCVYMYACVCASIDSVLKLYKIGNVGILLTPSKRGLVDPPCMNRNSGPAGIIRNLRPYHEVSRNHDTYVVGLLVEFCRTA